MTKRPRLLPCYALTKDVRGLPPTTFQTRHFHLNPNETASKNHQEKAFSFELNAEA
ncbi:TPA: hypothetical protein ACX6SA_002631 [Photobacterium damselae]